MILAAGPHCLFACPSCQVAFLFPQPAPQQLESLYDEQYYGRDRKKFAGAIEAAITALTRLKWNGVRPWLGESGRLLDIGCGRGTLVQLARAAGFEAYGLERHYPGTPPVPYVLYQDLAECAFPAGHFQVVVLWHVLEHLSDPMATLQEIRRVLAPGGCLSVAVPNFGGAQARASGAHWFHLDLPRHFWHFSPPALEALLERSGFHITRRETFSFEYDWFGTLQSWMNRLANNENRLYARLKGEAPTRNNAGPQMLLAAALSAPALASALWDAARGRGGTLTVLARTPQKP
jgi:SAM-dependent methyltransferase